TRRIPHRHTALALKQGSGPCTFLDGRRCSIYPNRPHYCRQFPFHVHLMDRVQVSLDLSCRGVWVGKGEDATPIGLSLVKENERQLRVGLEEAREVHRQFLSNCREAGIEVAPRDLRARFEAVSRRTAELPFLGWMLDQSVEDERLDLGKHPADLALDDIRAEELRQAAMEVSLESLSSEDPMSSPVYCDPNGKWNVFISSDGELDMYQLLEEGGMERKRGVDPKKVPLLAPQGPGSKLFTDYLSILNRRDSVLGYAYYLLDDYGYEDDLPNVYYGVLASSGLDLLWRASLVAYLNGGELDEAGVREGIIFYDMDRLDAPTIGAFM
ncbi:MAG: YkgJ family cysteine cluster protein, partial [Methanomassiliicoccales archaeon]|nr:YkgJ family cysteine cluster protein [Methanomassiliicoccales archaeon]